jgi:hypothetical protein
MSQDEFITYPKNINSPRTLLGEYRGWEITIGVARGEDDDILSVDASKYGTSFCRSFGKYVPCGCNIPRPSDMETKQEVDCLKRSIDSYESNK